MEELTGYTKTWSYKIELDQDIDSGEFLGHMSCFKPRHFTQRCDTIPASSIKLVKLGEIKSKYRDRLIELCEKIIAEHTGEIIEGRYYAPIKQSQKG